jgi:hypothetical protein
LPGFAEPPEPGLPGVPGFPAVAPPPPPLVERQDLPGHSVPAAGRRTQDRGHGADHVKGGAQQPLHQREGVGSGAREGSPHSGHGLGRPAPLKAARIRRT